MNVSVILAGRPCPMRSSMTVLGLQMVRGSPSGTVPAKASLMSRSGIGDPSGETACVHLAMVGHHLLPIARESCRSPVSKYHRFGERVIRGRKTDE